MSDAFTGEALDLNNMNLALIIPQILNGKSHISNLVPCNFSTVAHLNSNNMWEYNEDFNEAYILSWYQNQDFFNPIRFIKITLWLAQDEEYRFMEKYKYLPLDQLKYIDTFDKNVSIQSFDIYCIDRTKKTLFYSNRYNRELFSKQVYDVIIKKYEDDINKNWLSSKGGYFTSTRFLDRCADYILNGEFDYNHMIKYQDKEIPASNVSTECMNKLEISGGKNEQYEFDISGRYKYKQGFEEDIIGNNKPYKSNKNKTKLSKLNNLYSKKECTIQILKALTNEEVYDGVISGKDSDWYKKLAKNIFGQNIYDTKEVVYEARNGIINPDIPFKIEWHYVDALGEFRFNNKSFNIDLEKHIQYVDISKTNKKGKNTYWSMDHILCIEQSGKYHFYDINILRLTAVTEKRD